MKKILIPLILLVLVGAGVAVYFLAFSGEPEEEPPVLVAYDAGESYVTNVKDSGKLFRTGIYLIVDDLMMVGLSDKTSPTIPLIRDTILYVLRSLTEQDITAPNAQSDLAQKITDAVNERLGLNQPDADGKLPPRVHDVSFIDFVMS